MSSEMQNAMTRRHTFECGLACAWSRQQREASVVQHGARCRFYGVNRNLCIDLDSLADAISENAHLLVVIHILGFPEELAGIRVRSAPRASSWSDNRDSSGSEYAQLLHGQAVLAEGGNLPDPGAFSKLVAELMVQSL